MQSRLYSLLILSLLILTGCEGAPLSDSECTEQPDPNANLEKVTINEGMWGNVWFYKGDFMPGCPTGDITSVARKIYVYETTSTDQAKPKGTGPFYTDIETELITTTTSSDSGFFELQLAPGTYSLFVKEDDAFYANGIKDGMINPVTVTSDSVTKVQLDITYQATY